jgi:hypothetical protein
LVSTRRSLPPVLDYPSLTSETFHSYNFNLSQYFTNLQAEWNFYETGFDKKILIRAVTRPAD